MLNPHKQITSLFYSHVNYSVTKICITDTAKYGVFYSHVNYSVTKIGMNIHVPITAFYSHVNYSVTKICRLSLSVNGCFTVT